MTHRANANAEKELPETSVTNALLIIGNWEATDVKVAIATGKEVWITPLNVIQTQAFARVNKMLKVKSATGPRLDIFTLAKTTNLAPRLVFVTGIRWNAS